MKVLPGTTLPTDGIVVSGETSIDESMVTGESLPVFKKPGDTVFGGTVNQQGAIQMRATEIVSDNILHKITKLVQDAQNSKPPIQFIADNVAAYFVPSIIILAGAYQAEWSEIEKLLKDIGINNAITNRQESKKGHKSSRITMNRINDVITFLNFIYQKPEYGLERKRIIASKTASLRVDHIPNNLLLMPDSELKEMRTSLNKKMLKRKTNAIRPPSE